MRALKGVIWGKPTKPSDALASSTAASAHPAAVAIETTGTGSDTRLQDACTKPGFWGSLTPEQLDLLAQIKARYPSICAPTTLALWKDEEQSDQAPTKGNPTPVPSSNTVLNTTATEIASEQAASLVVPSESAAPPQQPSAEKPDEKSLAAPNATHKIISPSPKVLPGQEDDKGSELDVFYLRYLRARQWDLQKACDMLEESLRWQLSFKVKELREIIRFPFIPQVRKAYPHGYYGVDKIGRPIYIDCIGQADINAVLKIAPLEHLLAYWVQQYEYLKRVILPACSIAAGRRIEQGVSILDLRGFGLSHAGTQSRTVFRRLTRISQNFYPEMLGFMIVINAPSIAKPAWAFAKALLDEGTVKKIQLYTSDWRAPLYSLVNQEDLPDFLTGAKTPNPNWMLECQGPWKNPDIIAKLKKRMPSIPDALLNLDVNSESSAGLDILSTMQDITPPGSSAQSSEADFEKALQDFN